MGLPVTFFNCSRMPVMIDVEFVVDQKHAFVGDERRGVAGHDIVVDDVDIILQFDET